MKAFIMFFLSFFFILGNTQLIASHNLFNPNKSKEYHYLREGIKRDIKDKWCSQAKAELIMDLIFSVKPKVLVEVGTYDGASFLPIAVSGVSTKASKIMAIEAWSNSCAIKGIPENDSNYIWWRNVDLKSVRESFYQLMRHWKLIDKILIIEQDSNSVIFTDEEIDFLHIDGNFSEIGSYNDVCHYLPFVKKGGYILLSNVFYTVDGKHSKMSSMWKLFDSCNLVMEIDNSNTLLFQKDSENT